MPGTLMKITGAASQGQNGNGAFIRASGRSTSHVTGSHGRFPRVVSLGECPLALGGMAAWVSGSACARCPFAAVARWSPQPRGFGPSADVFVGEGFQAALKRGGGPVSAVRCGAARLVRCGVAG